MSRQQQADLSLERSMMQKWSVTQIAGLDEAGRGALAGPVTAAAVILPLADPQRLKRFSSINDSKQLSAKKRALYYDIVVENALAYGIGSASAARIDKEGIISATKHAMKDALRYLNERVEFLLIDGRIRLNDVRIAQQSIVRGDSRSLSIAAASILAKVTRDRYMIALDPLYPAYGFGRHKGYGTAQHLAAIQSHGPLTIHRHTFAPINQT